VARANQDRIHALSIPTAVGTLLVPSATIAEVVNISTITPIPLAPVWSLGVISWRTLGVPVVSFEAMFGQAVKSPTVLSKAVVFYPLAGRAQTEFFAILSSAEPRPQTVDVGVVTLEASELPHSPYVAGGLKIGGSPFWIPDLEGLKKTFYP
jgi:chemosensory pili system protein ChpC